MASYNHDQEQKIPDLLPIKKKNQNKITINTPSEKKSVKNDTLNTIIKDSIEKTPSNLQKDMEKNINQFKKQQSSNEKNDQVEKKNKEKQGRQRRDQLNKIENEKTKENQKMKALIAQMLNSMSIKNPTQQLYPVSNQNMEELMTKIEEEINDLNIQMQRKESSNQNDFHVKKQLETIKRQIDHCCLIKQLYEHKMNYRNKIQSLQEQIINLRSENRDLKLKVCRGIQSIENYKHNLPCDRQKELIQKLSVCTQQLNQEKEMRQNLQKNIESIIMNFKKLYQEADSARQIVTRKLKQIEERQKKLKKNKNYQQTMQQQSKKQASFDMFEQKRNISNSYLDFSNDLNQGGSSRRQAEQDSRKSPLRLKSGTSLKEKEDKQKEIKQKKTSDVIGTMSLEEKIKKMRNNQSSFRK